MTQPAPEDAAVWEAAAEAMRAAAATADRLYDAQMDFTEWALSLEPRGGEAP